MQNNTRIQQKIQPLDALAEQVSVWKKAGARIVFTNGVFDLLHAGHIDYLARAADLGDKLVIGVNSDASVKRLNKGPARPIKDEQTRSLILASLFFTDAITVFDDDTPYALIERIVPDVLVKGGDYDPSISDPQALGYIVGSDVVREAGGEVNVIAFVPGHSTTLLEQKIVRAAHSSS
ncbi:MAG: adenylyltransferase/cytidyltransferase family protein [Leptolyngbya sp. SIO3F4]|nr:adenylyltransferase/cytidyltransferase family protein [Leptolyngbya sp. SIO3F4]